MNELNPQPAPSSQSKGFFEPGAANIQLIYILYLVSLIIGITSIVAVVLSYVNRGKSEAWLDTHYTWAIRTFWIGLLYGIVSAVLMIVGIGFLLLFAVAVWMIIRVVLGLQAINRNEPIKNPDSWLI